MKIYIPSKGRAGEQLTLQNLPEELKAQTTLVVYPEEMEAYRRWKVKLLSAPERIKELGGKRQFIFEYHAARSNAWGNKFVVLDDDICQFAYRRKDDPTKFTRCQSKDVLRMFKLVERLLDDYPFVSVAGREGANRRTEPILECVRMMRFLAYDAARLKICNVKFDRAAAPMDDFDVHLQLLRAGYKSGCLNSYCQDQARSGAPGGCSDWRAAHPNAEAAEGLHALHPEFVKLVTKTTKTAWGGCTRIDVVVQWKKAYENSRVI